MSNRRNAFIYTISIFAVICLFNSFPSAYGQKNGQMNAKDLFEYHCVTCHGSDGKGTKRGQALKAPNLSDANWQASRKDEEILNSIINGKNKMPRWSDKLKEEEIQSLARYVRKLAPQKRP
ncbi:MAG: cytochrome c [Candidatus Jettenia sp.]|nr:cytochrome c [Candidatus Jettenia sp. AMX1]MBC6930028.1 cytochrome c [Candidatus Jettenia sp.]NUN23257.1 cytochrome c [Candidatus Jettenia caeni]KAA0248331.1 MAG: cytochrome c [Candidatus Jettenia sp. AMX1]MCE7881684.1 cytochrome c [Candidatus Jettenia sp. AMX1]MCQ3928334.1 hypothetical protein [Candidatus Jettenia sp.]